MSVERRAVKVQPIKETQVVQVLQPQVLRLRLAAGAALDQRHITQRQVMVVMEGQALLRLSLEP
jgi:hypothetical protein